MNWTQRVLSKKIDCTSACVSLWVLDKSKPTTHYRKILLEIMAEHGFTLKEG